VAHFYFMAASILRNPTLIATLLFLAGAVQSWLFTANYFGASLDEGIYLNGGQRIAAGDRLYVDFFGFVGPLTYWLQALLYQLFGNQIPMLRLSTAVSVGAIVSGLFCLGKRVGGVACGVVGSLLWLGVWLDLPNRMEVNHRWVSMAFFSIAMTALLSERRHGRFIGGVATGFAIFTTPSFAVCAGIVGLYLLVMERPRFWPYVIGGICSCSLVVGVLAAQGSLGAFLEGIRWAAQNYGDANRFPYGRFPAEVPWRYFLQVYMGAICIPISLGMLALYWLWKRDARLLLPAVLGLALLCTAYPKWDAYSLHFISGPYFVLIFCIVYLLVPEPLKQLAQGLSLALFTYLLINAWALPGRLTVIPTRAGTLVGSDSSARTMEQLEQVIPAKSTLFVYPYLTGLYALLDTRNEVPHDYLQPGMMTSSDEDLVLVALEKKPPQFVFWQDFPDADILRLWPNSNPDKHRFTRLEDWIRQHYRPDLEIVASNIRGRVWVRLK
jgi:hypothetical protein